MEVLSTINNPFNSHSQAAQHVPQGHAWRRYTNCHGFHGQKNPTPTSLCIEDSATTPGDAPGRSHPRLDPQQRPAPLPQCQLPTELSSFKPQRVSDLQRGLGHTADATSVGHTWPYPPSALQQWEPGRDVCGTWLSRKPSCRADCFLYLKALEKKKSTRVVLRVILFPSCLEVCTCSRREISLAVSRCRPSNAARGRVCPREEEPSAHPSCSEQSGAGSHGHSTNVGCGEEQKDCLLF